MKTDRWIEALAADSAVRTPSVRRAVLLALAPGLLVALLLFLALLGARPDFAAAMETLRFPFKFVVTLALAATALAAALRLSAPGAPLAGRGGWLLLAPALLAAAVLAELLAVPASTWGERLVGHNWRVCLVAIPLLSLAPLAALLVALRSGASTAPRLSGAIAGLAAGGFGATLYAAHCPDDSPLFVATWYVIAIALMAAIGAVAGARWLKW